MLFHVSIDAEDPRHVAQVLAEIMGGRAMPFQPVGEGSWVAHGGDDRNTLVEVYPRGTLLFEGPDGVVGVPGPRAARSPVHIALGTPLDEDAIHAIGRREGWPVETYRRGSFFRVIELWVERTRLVEVLTPAMQAEYLAGASLAQFDREMAVAA
ncbi:MAG: hypothetical protein SNJ79_07000 [Sphingomonadaceae bacterium]